jgi:hypothetical protein
MTKVEAFEKYLALRHPLEQTIGDKLTAAAERYPRASFRDLLVLALSETAEFFAHGDKREEI